jgi:diguanylate cyclase (GGDEF)-like protein
MDNPPLSGGALIGIFQRAAVAVAVLSDRTPQGPVVTWVNDRWAALTGEAAEGWYHRTLPEPLCTAAGQPLALERVAVAGVEGTTLLVARLPATADLPTDALTGLPTRDALRRGDASLAGPCAVLFIDLDDLKGLNDQSGHAAGDAALRGVADRVRAALRATDLVVRYGGDELVAVIEGVPSEAAAARIAAKVVAAARGPSPVDARPVTVSVGVAWRTEAGALGPLVSAADEAMYAAKRAGGDRWAGVDPG